MKCREQLQQEIKQGEKGTSTGFTKSGSGI